MKRALHESTWGVRPQEITLSTSFEVLPVCPESGSSWKQLLGQGRIMGKDARMNA